MTLNVNLLLCDYITLQKLLDVRQLQKKLSTGVLQSSILTIYSRITKHRPVIRVMRVLTKRLRLESRCFRYKVALYLSYLHVKFDYKTKGNPFKFRAYFSISLSIGDSVLQPSTVVRNLGVYIDEHLWKPMLVTVPRLAFSTCDGSASFAVTSTMIHCIR